MSSIIVSDVIMNNVIILLPRTCTALKSSNPRLYDYVDSIFEFSNPGIGHIWLFMALEGLLFFTLTLLIEVSHVTVM